MQAQKLLLDKGDVCLMLGVNLQTLNKYIRDEVLPPRVVINSRKKGWLKEDIEAWLQQRKERRSRK